MDSFYKNFGKFLILILIIFGAIRVSAATGTVQTSATCTQGVYYKYNCAQIVSDSSYINFGCTHCGFQVTDTELSGYAWSSKMGWINFNCDVNGGSNCVHSNHFKVSVDAVTGDLSGYAWGQNAGWINFNCDVNGGTNCIASNHFKVNIDPDTGYFSGYAWSQNYGWINFDGLRTSWPLGYFPTVPACSDGIDNDGDGLIDAADPGCLVNGIYNPNGISEYNAPPGGGGGHGGGGTGGGGTGGGGTGGGGTGGDTGGGTGGGGTGGDTGGGTGGGGTGGDTGGGTGGGGTGGDTGGGTGGENGGGTGGETGGGIGGVISSGLSNIGGAISSGASAVSNFVSNFIPTPIKEEIKVVTTAVKKAGKETAKVINSPAGQATAKTVTSVGVVSGATVSVVSALFMNPLSFSELFLIPIRLWALLMAALGFKRRNKPWGTVYDSITKQPLDPAYVVVQDLNGNEVATSITDMDGRYGFLIPAGKYKLLAHKANYKFPSEKLVGKTSDELYNDIYMNDIVETLSDGEVITKNIPMDPEKFDWNEFTKRDQHMMKFYSKRNIWINRISDFVFYFGFAITMVAVLAAPKAYNLITLTAYIVLYLFKRTILKPRPYGTISFKDTGIPLSFAILRVYSTSMEREVLHKVSDKTGKFYCLIPSGVYNIKIEKKNIDESYTEVFAQQNVEVKNGFINTRFEVGDKPLNTTPQNPEKPAEVISLEIKKEKTSTPEPQLTE